MSRIWDVKANDHTPPGERHRAYLNPRELHRQRAFFKRAVRHFSIDHITRHRAPCEPLYEVAETTFSGTDLILTYQAGHGLRFTLSPWAEFFNPPNLKHWELTSRLNYWKSRLALHALWRNSLDFHLTILLTTFFELNPDPEPCPSEP